MMKNKGKTVVLLILILLYLCFLNISPNQITDALEEQKQMAIDVAPSIGSQQNFTVSVYDINATNQTPSPYLVGVTIFFNNNTYQISSIDEDGEISIRAPVVSLNTSYSLIAQKQGYRNATATINVTPFFFSNSKQLFITPEEFTVDAEKQFTVMVYDETGTPVAEATVGIQNHIGNGSVAVTNAEGQAFLEAPNQKTIILIAQKQGYQDATEKLWVDTNPDFFNKLFGHPHTVIIVAGIVLLFTIIYITFFNKSKTSSFSPSEQHKKPLKHRESNPNQRNKTMNPQSRGSSSKVEEIRITRKQPEKKIIPIEHIPRNTLSTQETQQSDSETWCKGNEKLEYTINKITKNPKEKNKDKWVAGKTDIQQKIDKTLKEKQMNQKKKDDQ